MPKLRILRVSGNRLQQLDAVPFPNLRTLYADNNSLDSILKAHCMTKLENPSLRNQSGRTGLTLSLRDVRDVKRLYLSGNPIPSGFISEPCYNLIYMELAACRLTSLPQDLAKLIPNVRVLNLNYNFLEDTRPLEGLTRLRKLTIIGSRIIAAKQFVRVLKGMQDIEMLDFRYAHSVWIILLIFVCCIALWCGPIPHCGRTVALGYGMGGLPFQLSLMRSLPAPPAAFRAHRRRERKPSYVGRELT